MTYRPIISQKEIQARAKAIEDVRRVHQEFATQTESSLSDLHKFVGKQTVENDNTNSIIAQLTGQIQQLFQQFQNLESKYNSVNEKTDLWQNIKSSVLPTKIVSKNNLRTVSGKTRAKSKA